MMINSHGLKAAALALPLLSLAPAVAQPAAGGPDSRAMAIRVGPNVVLSRDPEAGHIETDIAVNPIDGSNLVAASISMTMEDGSATCTVYSSRDSGVTWTEVRFPASTGGVDPQVAFGPGGTAYFLKIEYPPSLDRAGAVAFYRSEDGGVVWTEASLPLSDHPQMVVDLGSPKFKGRVYFSGMYNVRRPGLMWSADEGRSFQGPIDIPNPNGYWLLNDAPQVLRDGTLFIPFRLWDDRSGAETIRTVSAFVLSPDGGQTFTELRRIFEHPHFRFSPPPNYPGTFVHREATPMYAVDRSREFDRIYMAWSDTRLGQPRVFLSYSDDRGSSWAEPVPVSPAVPGESSQWLPMLAVNASGVVALAWQDSRDDPSGHAVHYYFSASPDGRSFLPAHRLTRVEGRPFAGANLRLAPNWVQTRNGAQQLAFSSAYRRWPEGGDYMGMAADPSGVFHPLWADARTGVFQLMSSEVHVTPPAPPPAGVTTADVTGDVQLLFGRPRYEPATKQTIVPVRLRNRSTRPLYPPFVVRLDSLKYLDVRAGGVRADSIDYSSTLGDLGMLPPGRATEPREWTLRSSTVREMATVNVTIEARVQIGATATRP